MFPFIFQKKTSIIYTLDLFLAKVLMISLPANDFS